MGGLPAANRLVREDGVWKVDVLASMDLALRIAQDMLKDPRDDLPKEWQKSVVREEASPARPPLAEAGKTPEATLRAYYYYKDRGLMTKLRPLVAQSSLSMLPEKDGAGISARAQEFRGLTVDHKAVSETEAKLYYRAWFSLATKSQGGRLGVVQRLKEEGTWKFDINATIRLTLGITKGKNKRGFYDGTNEWWK